MFTQSAAENEIKARYEKFPLYMTMRGSGSLGVSSHLRIVEVQTKFKKIEEWMKTVGAKAFTEEYLGSLAQRRTNKMKQQLDVLDN